MSEPTVVEDAMQVALGVSVYAVDLANSSVKDMAVNGSVTPKNYDWVASGPTIVTNIHLTAWDNASEVPNGFFTLAALTNGLDFEILDAGLSTIWDLTDGVPFKNHALLAMLGDDFVTTTQVGGGASNFQVGLDPAHTHLGPVAVQEGWRIRMTVNDDLSTLQGMYLRINGRLYE
jgi:hypothetical protein